MQLKFIVLFLSALTLGACATQNNSTFYWGSYENALYDMYAEKGNHDPGQQIDDITHDIEKSKAADKQIAPGVYAHLGYLYTVTDNYSAAKAALETEKRLYPESTVFVDGLLARMK